MAALLLFVCCRWRPDAQDFDIASHYSGSTENDAIALAEGHEGKTWDRMTDDGWFISKGTLLVRPIPVSVETKEEELTQPRKGKKRHARKS